jgi:hypothetical protein
VRACRAKDFALRGSRERMFYVYLLHSAKDNGFYRVKGFASRGLVGLF